MLSEISRHWGYVGIIPCFFLGLFSTLSIAISKALISRGLVSAGQLHRQCAGAGQPGRDWQTQFYIPLSFSTMILFP